MSNSDIQFGHLDICWNDDYKRFPYVRQNLAEEEVNKWKANGYDHVKSFTGMLYDSTNTMPDWVNHIRDAFGLYKQTHTIYKMQTLEIMPTHVDYFKRYAELKKVDVKDVWRVVMMLEDWKPGHYFELNGVGYTNWKAGDWFKWRYDVPHAAANIGIEDRYTLQVTGVSMHVGQLNKLLCFNVPGVEDADNSHPNVRHLILPNIDENKPSMVYTNNSFIRELDSINHTNQSEIELLNEKGLDIYLYEPICSYDCTNPVHTQEFYSEFSNIDPMSLRAEELDSINDYAKRNGITNITVHSCDYNIDKFYPAYNFKLTCNDIFLKSQTNILNLDETINFDFTKKFICLNWRFTKHRQLVSTFLAGKDGYLSCYFKTDLETLKKGLFFNLDDWKNSGLYDKMQIGAEILNTQGPFYVDKKPTDIVTITDTSKPDLTWPLVSEIKPSETPSLHNFSNNPLQEFYRDIFFDIVNETRFAQPTGNFSEKVFQNFQYKKPFVLVAPPKTLEYIKSFGYKSFNDFWDESYDDEWDHGVRLEKILNVIDSILMKPIEELREIYKDMLPILEHNFQIYNQRAGIK